MFTVAILALAAVLNIGAIYFLKRSDGFTVLWPTLTTLVLIGLTQLCIGRAMANGTGTGLAITAVVAAVMVGSAAIGMASGEPLTAQRAVGLAIAMIGIVIASLSSADGRAVQ